MTAERWQPLLNEVSRQTGVSLRFATASGITRFEERVLAGKYDFVYLNSLLFQEAQKSRGYRALVRDEQPLGESSWCARTARNRWRSWAARPSPFPRRAPSAPRC